jgi:hypothetical protein
VRKRIEEVFGWSKAAAGFRKTRHCGLARVRWIFTLTITAYNLVRLPKLIAVVRLATPGLCPDLIFTRKIDSPTCPARFCRNPDE